MSALVNNANGTKDLERATLLGNRILTKLREAQLAYTSEGQKSALSKMVKEADEALNRFKKTNVAEGGDGMAIHELLAFFERFDSKLDIWIQAQGNIARNLNLNELNESFRSLASEPIMISGVPVPVPSRTEESGQQPEAEEAPKVEKKTE